MTIMLNITQAQLENEVKGIDDFITTIGVEVSENIESGDQALMKRLEDLIFLINIRQSLSFYSVESDFLTQDDIRYLINQAKKVIQSIELPDNSIYQ